MVPSFVHSRFTLVELMIVVAIISILAAIAVPAMHNMALKAKFSEMPLNTEGIMTAQVAYESSADVVLHIPTPNPGLAGLGKMRRPWLPGSDFDTLGWAPDGEVYGSYWTYSGSVNCQTGGVQFPLSHGQTNIDGDAFHGAMNCCWPGVQPSGTGEIYGNCMRLLPADTF